MNNLAELCFKQLNKRSVLRN